MKEEINNSTNQPISTSVKKVLLSTGYFPPIQYFSKLLKYNEITLDRYENYEKQSYRNRCHILSANGILSLSIPIKKSMSPKTLIIDTKIDYTENWQTLHLRAISSAYNSSPFHEFYIDALMPFFEKKFEFLFDFNLQIINKLAEEMEINLQIAFSKSFQTNSEELDLRDKIHPKKTFEDSDFTIKKYTQVFSEKFGFTPNLSILDLLFNEGPNCIDFLK
jgi:hypothetical protein